MSRHFLSILILASLSVLAVVGIALANVPPVPLPYLDTNAPSVPADDGNTSILWDTLNCPSGDDSGDRPDFLDTSVCDVAADDRYTYQFWYTLVCPSVNTNTPCECDDDGDTNDCIGTLDTDNNGLFDQAQDDNGNTVPDVVDPDFETRQAGVIESAVRRFTDTVHAYITDWGFRAPIWLDVENDQNVEHNRRIWLYNTESGKSGASAYGIQLNTRQILPTGPQRVVPHETWHKIQIAYYDRGRQPNWVHEGQARSVEDKIFDELKAANHGAYNRLLGNPTYTLALTQVVTQEAKSGSIITYTIPYTKAYGLLMNEASAGYRGYDAALWWTYFAEQFGDNYMDTLGAGMDAWDTFLEQEGDRRYGLGAMNAAIAAESTTSVHTFEDAYRDFVVANYAKELNVSRIPTSDLDGRDPVAALRYRDEGRESATPTTYDSPKFDVDAALFGNTQAGHVNAHVPDMEVDETDPGTNEPDDPPTRAMPAWGARYYRGNVTRCKVAAVRVEGDEGARLAFAFLAVRPDTDEYGRKEADRLIRSVGQDFAAAVWTGSSQYDHIALIVAGLEDPYGYTYTLGCTVPTMDIVHPTASDQVHAGNPQNPERFLIWLNVAGDAPFATPSLAGLDWQRDFRVFVGPANVADNEATILDGDYVMGRYWLLVQAPDKLGAAYGSIYDLTVRLGGTLNKTQDNAVVYDVVRTDRMLVIDRTGSMAGEKIVAAKAAARLHTEDLFRFDRLGVVSYAVRPALPSATVDYPLTLLPDATANNVRLGAQNAIAGLEASGETSIAAGLDLAQDQLDNVASDNEWWMVLLSDGRENHDPRYPSVRDRLMAAGTKVHAIALGEDAQEDLMRTIATDTCGEDMLDVCYHHIAEPGVAGNTPVRDEEFTAAAQPLINRLSDLYTQIAEKIASHDRLWENEGHIAGGGTVTQTISIQESGIKNAVFSFHWDQVGAVTVVLRNPTGAEVIPGPGMVHLEDRRGPNHLVWQIANPVPGIWTATMTAPFTATNYVASLSGRQTTGVQLRVFLDRAVGDRWVGLPLPIMANLADSRGRVLNASVRAEISHPSGRLDTLDLYDDGAHGDGVAGDGTYGGHYTRVTRPGSYDIRVVASGTNNGGGRFTRFAHLSYVAVAEPTSADPDRDGLPTRWEVRFGLNPFNANGRDGAAGDPDQDSLRNHEEFLAGTNPIDADSDWGGESDGSEAAHGRNPLDGKDDVVRPPREVWVEPGNGRNDIYFTPDATCIALGLERTTNLDAGFAFRGDFTGTGPITDTGLVNGTLYYYRLRCDGAGGTSSRYTQVVYGRPMIDTIPPEGYVIINNGAEHTENLSVTLSLGAAADATHMQISNRADFRHATWELYTYTRPWILEPVPQIDEATVYVQFRDGSGNISPAEYDSIRYQPPQEVTILAAAGGVLNSPEGRLHLVIPPGALPADAIFRYTRLERPPDAPARYTYAGAHFLLEVRQVANGMPIARFNVPLQLRLNYQDYEWRNGPVGDEATLGLFRRAGSGSWVAVTGSVDPASNRLTVALKSLSEFGFYGQTHIHGRVYLPLIFRGK